MLSIARFRTIMQSPPPFTARGCVRCDRPAEGSSVYCASCRFELILMRDPEWPDGDELTERDRRKLEQAREAGAE